MLSNCPGASGRTETHRRLIWSVPVTRTWHSILTLFIFPNRRHSIRKQSRQTRFVFAISAVTFPPPQFRLDGQTNTGESASLCNNKRRRRQLIISALSMPKDPFFPAFLGGTGHPHLRFAPPYKSPSALLMNEPEFNHPGAWISVKSEVKPTELCQIFIGVSHGALSPKFESGLVTRWVISR